MTETFRHSRKIISGTGWSNPLTHAFQLENSAHVKVYADDTLLTLGVDYTLDEIGNPAGYEVNIVIPDPGDEPVWWDNDLFILSVEAPVGQDDDISLGGQFGVQFEGALDRLARRLQQVYDMALRAIKSPRTTDPSALDQDDLTIDPSILVTLPLDAQAAQDAADAAEEDAEQTALDRIATAADRVQTGLDRAAVAGDKATVAADKATVAADKGTVAADKATVAADKATASAAAVTATAKAVLTAADAVSTAADVVSANAALAAAVAARDAALGALDSFDDTYLGPKAANPTLDNDGNALIEGQLYWNTVDNELRFYDGASWIVYNLNGYVSIANLNATNKAVIVDTDRAFGSDSASSFSLAYYIFTDIWTWITTKLNATNKATPVAADRVPILDSAASNVPKYSTLTQIMAVIFASPALTSTPTAPTAAPGTNTTQIATTAFVAALGALKANLASPTFTGTPAAPTAAAGTNTTQIATTAFVKAAVDVVLNGVAAAGDTLAELYALILTKADLASPALTGTPTAPTAAPGTNSTQIATTAFVAANGGGSTGWALAGTITTTSGSTQSLTGIGTAHKGIKLILKGVSHSNGSSTAIRVALSSNNGSSYGTANAVTPAFVAARTAGGIVEILGAQTNGANKTIAPMTLDETGVVPFATSSTESSVTGIINAVQVSPGSGNLDAGSVEVWTLG